MPIVARLCLCYVTCRIIAHRLGSIANIVVVSQFINKQAYNLFQ